MAARKAKARSAGDAGEAAGAAPETAGAWAGLEARIGHRFADPRLLKLALTHASLGGASNERLEFLGDRVLGLIIAERLFADYPDESEGGLAVRLNALVRRGTCAKVAQAVGLGPYLLMAPAEGDSGGRTKTAILAGACEALIAALYLDGGMPAAESFVLSHWRAHLKALNSELKDAKTALQEWAQARIPGANGQPAYQVVERTGPDHAPVFTMEVRVSGQEPQRGKGATKREAEQEAARAMLLRLGLWQQ